MSDADCTPGREPRSVATSNSKNQVLSDLGSGMNYKEHCMDITIALLLKLKVSHKKTELV